MKKMLYYAIVIFMLIVMASVPVLATGNTEVATDKNILETENATKFAQMKGQFESKFAQYSEKYGSNVYGVVALVLDTIRIYSIPFCFIGIAVGAIYQYVIGIRKLDVRDRGFNLVIAFVTTLVICQILPLVFAIITRGWVL